MDPAASVRAREPAPLVIYAVTADGTSIAPPRGHENHRELPHRSGPRRLCQLDIERIIGDGRGPVDGLGRGHGSPVIRVVEQARSGGSEACRVALW